MDTNGSIKRIANAIFQLNKLLSIDIDHLEQKWRKKNSLDFFFFEDEKKIGKNWFFFRFFSSKTAKSVCFKNSKIRPIGRKSLPGCYLSIATVGICKIYFLILNYVKNHLWNTEDERTVETALRTPLVRLISGKLDRHCQSYMATL